MRLGQVIKLAAVVGPAVWRAVRRAGPVLARLRADHPEAFTAVQRHLTAMAETRKRRRGPEGALQRVHLLRDEVRYLTASADDEHERRQADRWSEELDGVQRAIALISTERRGLARAHLRQVDSRLDELSSKVLAAVITERHEDATDGASGPQLDDGDRGQKSDPSD